MLCDNRFYNVQMNDNGANDDPRIKVFTSDPLSGRRSARTCSRHCLFRRFFQLLLLLVEARSAPHFLSRAEQEHLGYRGKQKRRLIVPGHCVHPFVAP